MRSVQSVNTSHTFQSRVEFVGIAFESGTYEITGVKIAMNYVV